MYYYYYSSCLLQEPLKEVSDWLSDLILVDQLPDVEVRAPSHTV